MGLLKQFQAKANFFVIGKEAEKHPDLIKRILAEGHGIFSHSMDHQYFHYFKKQDHLKNWIQNSIQNLSVLTGEPAVCFRPPAGILTPPLLRAAEDLKLPFILWNHRFYDTAHTLTEKKVLNCLGKLAAGDIILLHDRQKPVRQATFLTSLKTFLEGIKEKGFLPQTLRSYLENT